jgi:hypothetical protein
MLLAAHSMGFLRLTSGQAMTPRLRDFRAAEATAVCCITIGTATHHRPGRVRPTPATFVSSL